MLDGISATRALRKSGEIEGAVMWKPGSFRIIVQSNILGQSKIDQLRTVNKCYQEPQMIGHVSGSKHSNQPNDSQRSPQSHQGHDRAPLI